MPLLGVFPEWEVEGKENAVRLRTVLILAVYHKHHKDVGSPPASLEYWRNRDTMITKEKFGTLHDGRIVTKYRITNHFGEYADILNYGATLHALAVQDRAGTIADVLLGVDNAAELPGASGEGVIIGRNANRIGKSYCVIEGKEYFFEPTERGNFLHSGSGNYALKFFSVTELSETALLLVYEDPGEGGFEGNVHVEVIYTFDDNHTLDIQYRMIPNTTTILNPTNHAYFNLGSYTDTREDTLWLFCGCYAPRSREGLPLGLKKPVAGTPYDFRMPKKLLERTEADIPDPRLKAVDDFYCIDGAGYRKAAELCCTQSGRIMETWTDFPALVLFVPGFCAKRAGKGGITYPAYGGVCIECQYMPDAVNHTAFEIPVFHAGEALEHRTTYRFRTDCGADREESTH